MNNIHKPSEPEQTSLFNSYFTILMVFARDPQTDEDTLESIRRWGLQLGITEEKLRTIVKNAHEVTILRPANQQTALEELYNLVYMIYLDNVVEDCEIETLMQYAKKLGFPAHIIGDLLKAMLTAPADGVPVQQVKSELKDLLEASLC